MTKHQPRLLLVDGHSLAYRAFFALPVENFATSTGQPTNAVYGFTSMLINVIRDEQPTHIAVAFDVSDKTFRTTTYADYKAGRAEIPPELVGQIALIREVLNVLGIVALSVDNYEADDIIATLATQAIDANIPVLISSGDRDAFQLVTEACTVLYPRKGMSDLARITPDEVQSRYGIPPNRYRDLAALVGEVSDNLPGVPGVGPKTAAKWINTYGSLDEIIVHVADIKGKVGDSLRVHLADVLRNYQLNALVRDLPLSHTVDELFWQGWDREQVHQLFDTLQFRTLRDRLYANLAPAEPATAQTVTVTDATLEPGTLATWLAEHSKSGERTGLAFTGNWGQGTGVITALALATTDGAAIWLDPAQLEAADDVALTTWLADEQFGKVAHDIKGPLLALRARGWQLRGLAADTAVQAYLVRPDQRTYDVADLALRYLQRELPQQANPSGQLSFDGLLDTAGPERQALLAQAGAARELAEVLDVELTNRGGARLLTEVELPLVSVLAQMEQVGIAADAEYLSELAAHFAAAVKSASQAAQAEAGREFNVASPKQLQVVLFDELKLPKTKRIKTGYTTDADALRGLFTQTQHPLLEHLLRHRDVAKLQSTVDGLLKAIADDGRIHSTFNQLIAATGRLSSADPNLQNIPIRTQEGRQIRRAFVVGNGYETLLTADYSQIEMRIMAHLSADTELIDAFTSGEDLHTTVASRVFSVSSHQVNAEMRRRIKAMSYGLVYGLSAYGLAQQLGISPEEARKLMDEYFQRFGKVRDYLRAIVEQARQDGYTETIFGRRRYLPDLSSDNRQRREIAERMALNAPVQGSAADIMKVAMLRVDAALTEAGLRSRLLLQVHDELVFEVAAGEAEQVKEIACGQMGSAYDLAVPLAVSVGSGTNWEVAAH